MNTTNLIAIAGIMMSACGCSKQEEKSSQNAAVAPQKNLKEKSPESEAPSVWLIPADMTTSAGAPKIEVHIQMNSGNVTKELIDGMVSRISWQTYPEGDEIKFTYSWTPPQPYEIPKNTPKGQPVDNSKPTDITGNPVGQKNSETRTSFSLSPDSKLEARWYQIVYNDEILDSVKSVQNVNPSVGNKIISRFNMASSPTVQSVQICKKGKENQKISVRFSEPVSYESLKFGMSMTPLADGSSCSFVEDIYSPNQAIMAEYLCTGLWGDTIAAKIKHNGTITSASSQAQLSLLNSSAKTQAELYSAPTEIEVNFKASYKENEYCFLWTP